MRISLLNVATLIRSSLIYVALLVLVGCTTTEVKYVSSPLPLPPPLEWTIVESELACVSEDTYSKIVGLDLRVKTLEGIIRSTHSPSPQQ